MPANAGWRTIAGPDSGLDRLLLVQGRLESGETGPQHLHDGEEILHVLSGRVTVWIGEEAVDCVAGDVVSIPCRTPHAFLAREGSTMRVVAEQRIGTLFRVVQPDGTVRTVEAFRRDMPWGREPRTGQPWTTDEEMRHILANLYRDPVRGDR